MDTFYTDTKSWDLLTPEEQMKDFVRKSEILSHFYFGEEVSWATFYQDYLFAELDNELEENYKVLLTEYDAKGGTKFHALNVDEIGDFLHLNDVALSPCLFHNNWKNKSLLNYVCGFVLDMDKVRPLDLADFKKRFDDGRIPRPTFIANSGSGVHFYYILDSMFRVDTIKNEANNKIAEKIYNKLYDIVQMSGWTDAQRHWVGQDYRVVNSKTKFGQTSAIFKIGDIYSIDDLLQACSISLESLVNVRDKELPSKAMEKYATNIANDLGIMPPNMLDRKEVHDFIAEHKDAAWKMREQKRKERKKKESITKKKKPASWYKNTYDYVMNKTQVGYRFSSLKALAIIAYKEQISRERFMTDLDYLAEFWLYKKYPKDKFNINNLDAIKRLFDNAVNYSNTSSEKLEEWLGAEFKRIRTKRNGRSQKDHVKRMSQIRDIDYPDGSWRGSGRKKGSIKDVTSSSKAQAIKEFLLKNPTASKNEVTRKTGFDHKTVAKWYDQVKELIESENTNDKQMTIYDYIEE